MPNPDDGNDADRRAFTDAMSTQIPHVFDDPGEVWQDHGVLSQPTMVFVSSDGSTTTFTGAAGPQRLLARVKELADAG